MATAAYWCRWATPPPSPKPRRRWCRTGQPCLRWARARERALGQDWDSVVQRLESVFHHILHQHAAQTLVLPLATSARA